MNIFFHVLFFCALIHVSFAPISDIWKKRKSKPAPTYADSDSGEDETVQLYGQGEYVESKEERFQNDAANWSAAPDSYRACWAEGCEGETCNRGKKNILGYDVLIVGCSKCNGSSLSLVAFSNGSYYLVSKGSLSSDRRAFSTG